jgi:hypothetical protein
VEVEVKAEELRGTHAMPQSISRVIMAAVIDTLADVILWPSRLPNIATSPSSRSHIASTICVRALTFWGRVSGREVRKRTKSKLPAGGRYLRLA